MKKPDDKGFCADSVLVNSKRLSMVFLAHHPKVQQMNPTIVVITDRVDQGTKSSGT